MEKIKSLIKKDKTYAFVLDYALFGYTDAAREGSYEAHASLFPNFEKCLEKLVDEGIIVKRSGSRYTGPTSYFEVNISRDVVINALKEFYEEVRSNLEFLRESLEKYSITNFFYIYENEGKVSFSVDGYLGEVERPYVEQTCKELVLKGLMFAWMWVTKKHVYKCYRFRQRPFNCLEEFEKLMEHKLSRFVKVKIDDYIRKEYGAKLDYILGLIQTRDWNETQKYLKERGWSEKLIWEVRNALERERIIPHDFSSSLFQFLEEELANRMKRYEGFIGAFLCNFHPHLIFFNVPMLGFLRDFKFYAFLIDIQIWALGMGIKSYVKTSFDKFSRNPQLALDAC